MFERIIEKLVPLEKWYAEHYKEVDRTRLQPFPPARKLDLLIQLLSLLHPITALNVKSQADAPTQIQTLLHVYHLRTTVLNP